jgi:ubiquinone/menaquinone biosynthesis C-methylase UbiE
LILEYGNEVWGVEPNLEMREAGEEFLASYAQFHSVDGTAEHTTLADQSVDLVIAAQAFHWFDPAKARTEFRRILKPEGWVALVWNDRKMDGTPFLRRYNDLLSTFEEYRAVDHKTQGAMKMEEFFDRQLETWSLPTQQLFDWEGLKGRALSSSYVPAAGTPEQQTFLEALKSIFEETAIDGKVAFEYLTQMFVGKP